MFDSISRMTMGQKLAIGGIVLLLGGLGSVAGYAFFPTATNQYYAPPQPIPFSHKLHAGDYKMDCKYCHSTAERSQHASVPSVNVCMNCHLVVKVDSPYIQAIHKANREGTPIEWVRIHELPDHVRFNHKPHVRAGVACQTCHGPVETMERVYQAAPLTMGWCIECHKGATTPPDVLERLHPGRARETFSKGSPVAPTDCSTCHH